MHGPFFYYGYKWLDTFASGPPSLKAVSEGAFVWGV